MPKKKQNAKSKKKKIKKRNYNTMIEQSQNIVNNNGFNNIDIDSELNSKKIKVSDKKHKDIFNFNFDFDKEYMPPSDLIEKNIDNRNLNSNIGKILFDLKEDKDRIKLKNLKFNENAFISEDIYGDGNCFYRAVSYYICNSEQYHLFFRNLIYDFITANKNDIIIKFPYVYYNGKAVDIEDYIPLIKKPGTYAGELEAQILSNILDIIILILEYKKNVDNNNYYSFLNIYGSLNKNILNNICIMEFKDKKNHYDLSYFLYIFIYIK